MCCGMPPALITRSTGTPPSAMRSRMMRVWKAVPSMAANSSSWAVCSRFQPSVMPPRSAFTRTVRSPLSQVRRRRPVWPARYCSRPFESSLHVGVGAPRDRLEDVARGRQARPRCPRASDRRCPARRRTRPGSGWCPRPSAMMQVEVPTTFTTSPTRQPAPMASQWASKAPTGIGMPACRPSRSAQ